MRQLNMSDCRSLAKNIKLPDHVRTSILNEAVRRNCESPSTAVPSGKHAYTRRFAVGACAVVAVAVAAAAGGTFLGGDSFFGSSAAEGNSFALAAYASEESGQTVALKRDFGTMAGFNWSDDDNLESSFVGEDPPSPAPDDQKGFASVSLLLDLSCIGDNVDTLTYSIEGDHAYFYQENWNWGPPPFTIGPPPDPQIQKSFSISYGKQVSDKTAVQRQLRLFFPLDEKARGIYELNGGPPWRRGASQASETPDNWYAELSAETVRIFAERIVQHPITLSATFKDGSTQTKTYLITPVSDFTKQLENHRDDEDAFHDLSSYFTLTEITDK